MTAVEGDVGNLISGGNFSAPVKQIIIYNREVLRAKEIDEETIQRFREIHVETLASIEARKVLQERSAVALTGSPGCGRRITGIALLVDLEVTPHPVVLDLEDLDRPLKMLSKHGYLLDLDEDHDQLTGRVGTWLQDLVAQARRKKSYLIVRARSQSWEAVELDEYTMKAIPINAPAAIEVFHSHLKNMTSSYVAGDWSQREQIVQVLAKAEPPEAVRLAQIVRDVRAAQIPDSQQLGEAIAAYRNWADTLTGWFREHDGYSRALLLATAALEGAPATTVFTAADRLAELVQLPREPGGVLVGPDVKMLVSSTTAELQGHEIHFTRPAYAESVLDYVWRERPHMHEVMRTWLTSIPDPRDEDSGRAARCLTELAIRQREGSLICSAAAQWAKRGMALRELGTNALTAAAMSQQVGREVRRQLYRWACAEKTPEELHLTVADVCGVTLAQVYPQIALTRLRHLANRQSLSVQNAVLDKVYELAQDPALRHDVIAEIATWVKEDREPRRSSGRRAFLRLASNHEGGVIAIPAPADPDVDLLAGLWRDALRYGQPADAVAEAAYSWLSTAAQNPVLRETVIEVLARTCRTSIDLAALTKVVIGWSRDVAGSPDSSGDDIATEVLHRAYQRDPIASASTQLRTDAL